jgi:hypothetical protein
MPAKKDISEARKLLSRVPDLKATVVGLLMGLVLALIAQLLLKPLEISPQLNGNMTLVYGSSRVAVVVVPVIQYVAYLVLAFAVAVFLYWKLQTRMLGLSGRTLDVRPHGLKSHDDIKELVDELTEHLQKIVNRIGWNIGSKYLGEDQYHRFMGPAKSSRQIVMTIDKEHVSLKSEMSALSLEVAEEILKDIDSALTALRGTSAMKGKYDHLVAHYFTRGASPSNPAGHRLLVNYHTRRAYHMNEFIDKFILAEKIGWEEHYDKSYKEWCIEQKLNLIERAATETELS